MTAIEHAIDSGFIWLILWPLPLEVYAIVEWVKFELRARRKSTSLPACRYSMLWYASRMLWRDPEVLIVALLGVCAFALGLTGLVYWFSTSKVVLLFFETVEAADSELLFEVVTRLLGYLAVGALYLVAIAAGLSAQAGIMGCALLRLQGQDPDLTDAWAAAVRILSVAVRRMWVVNMRPEGRFELPSMLLGQTSPSAALERSSGLVKRFPRQAEGLEVLSLRVFWITFLLALPCFSLGPFLPVYLESLGVDVAGLLNGSGLVGMFGMFLVLPGCMALWIGSVFATLYAICASAMYVYLDGDDRSRAEVLKYFSREIFETNP